ncbi:efflux RND transporter permease subunit [Lichenicoccus sp.]|uniref:efflux RND transporter permease subunit n=1 Tax=Lichenicoccus sp. TaxID=2781899 RepID=UPI003D0A8C5C
MERMFAAIVSRRWLVLVLALIVVAAGLWNMRELAIDAVPDISPKQVLILTEANGLGPLEVERLVTVPIEMQMVGLPKLKNVRSKSRFGLSAVYVTVKDDADVETERARIYQRLQLAKAMMPPGVGAPQEGPLTTGLGEIIEFELRGPGYTPMQLYRMLEWHVVPKLKLVPGIVNVDIYGGELQTYEVRVDPGRLSAEGVTLPQLFTAIQANNTARGGAYIESGAEQQVVRGMALLDTRADIANIVVRTAPGGIPVTVGDVARVVMAPKVRLGAVTHDGQGETVLGVAEMQYGLNSSTVLPKLEAGIKAVQKTLPKGVEIRIFYNRAGLVHRAIHTIAHNLIEGALFVVVILLLALGNLRAGLIVAAVIPVAMMMAFAGMRAFGIPANLMSLGAIDFGLVVDGAVVLVENVLRRQTAQEQEGQKDAGPVADAVPAAAAEVARPVLFSVAIITMVYIPVLTLQSIEGKMFRPMALTVMLALGSALLVTMLILPALAATFLSDSPTLKDTILVRGARRLYTPALARTTRHPWLTFGLAAGLFVASAWFALGLGSEFIPKLQEGAIVVTSNKLPGINLDASIRTVTEIERVIRSFPEVKTVVSQTGSAAVPTDPMGVQSTDSYAMLKPRSQWHGYSTQQQLRDAIEKKVKAAVPGVQFELSQPIEMRMNDLLQGVRSPVALTIYGHDLAKLRALARKAVKIVNAVKGASDVRADHEGGLPDLTVRVRRAALARYGVSANDVLDMVQIVGGRTVGTVYGSDEAETPIVVRLAPAARTSAATIGALPVALPGGGAVPLSTLADISVSTGPSQIERDQLERRIAVQIHVRGRSTNGFATAAQKAVAQKLHLPEGYRVEWSGQFKNLRSATARLALVVPVVMAVIFMMLYLNFGSLPLAALIFLNVPMAAIGGIAALALRGMPFSVSAGIGFISTFGIAILDGVVLISYIEQEREAGRSPAEAAREAAEKRLRPVLTTALVASIGFVPMAIATSTGAAVQRPLATVVIGGLITATLLTLLVLPALYPVASSWRKDETAKARRQDDQDADQGAAAQPATAE